MNDLLLQELNKLVGEQKDALAARKAEIGRLNERIAALMSRDAVGDQRSFELAVLRALSRLLWECGDSAGHEALQQLIHRREG